jgi:transcriptional regulator with XRE-family HTH domain
MTPQEFTAIRKASGFTVRRLAEVLRIQDERTIRRYQSGDTPVSGPVSILMEMLRDGTWRP